MPTIACPQCPAKLRLPDSSLQGKKATCPRCGHRFVIELPAKAEAPSAAPADVRDPAFVFEQPAAPTESEISAPVRRPRDHGVAKMYLLAGVFVAALGVGGYLLFGNTGKKPSNENASAKKDGADKKVASLPHVEPPQPEPPKREPEPEPEPRPEPKPEPKPEPELPKVASLPVPVNTIRPMEDKPILVLDAGAHTAIIQAAFFLAGDDRIVTVSYDKTIRIWDVKSADTLRVLRLPIGPSQEGAPYAAAQSPDRKLLAISGSPYGRGKYGALIHIVDVEAGKVVRTLTGHKHVVLGMAFSPDGKYLASASYDKTARLYDLENGTTLRELIGHENRVKDAAFSPDGKQLVTAAGDNTARVWSLETGKQTALLKGHTNELNCCAWSPDGNTIATGSSDASIRTWKPDGTALRTYEHPSEKLQATSLEFRKNGELLYTGIGDSGRAGLLELETGKYRVEFNTHSNTVTHGSLSSDGKLAVSSGGNNHETYVWKTDDGVQVQEFYGGGKSIWALGWSPDGKQIAWGNTNLGQTIKSETSLEFTFNLESFDFGPPPGEKMQRAVLARDGYSLEALDFYKIAIKQGDKIVHTYVSDLQKERIYSMTMLAGKKAAIGGAYGLTLVDLETGKSIHEFDGHSGQVLAVAPSPDGKYFLSGGTDQTIYLWDPAVKTPLMTFFVAGRHWIAWHPSGFYAASPMGERLMGWQLNHGPEKMASFHPALRFHASLYRPEVVRRLPLAGSLDQAIALARKAGHDVADITGVGAVLPPRVRIDSPTAALALDDKGEFEVKASAESEGDHPVLSLRLLVDGRPYAGENGIRPVPKPGPGKVTAAWKVVVPPGKHQVAVQAVSKVSRAVTPPLEITYTQKEPPRPNLYFVGIGITAYPGDLRLQFAAKDAEVLANVLREKSRPLYDKIEIKLLTDASATRANIMKELSWLRGSMTAKDVAIFFFSGHGGRDELNQFQMLPVDVDLDALDKTCVSGAFLKQTLENMPGRVVAILDACHSGEVADLPDSKKRVADSLVRDLVSEDYGVVVMCSSLGSEFSLEDPDAGHGFFTYGLVEGLNGLADYNRDQVVFIHELDFYAALRTTQRSRGLQHPTTSRPPGIRTFALSKP